MSAIYVTFTGIDVTGAFVNAMLVGENQAMIERSGGSGTVSGGLSDSGGLAGINTGFIYDSFDWGLVSTTNSVAFVGGFVGANFNNGGSTGANARAYSFGQVTGVSGSKIGCFAGSNEIETNCVLQAYYNTDTCAASAVGVGSNLGITPLTTLDFQTLPAGFRPHVWKLVQPPGSDTKRPFLLEIKSDLRF